MIERILLKETIKFEGTVEELKAKLNDRKGSKFKLEWISDQEFKFLAFLSVGTLMVQGMPGAIDGIKGYGTIHEKNESLVLIELSTKIRVELYFMTLLFISFFIGSMLLAEDFPFWIYFFFPPSLLLYWYILRRQEIALFESIRECLK